MLRYMNNGLAPSQSCEKINAPSLPNVYARNEKDDLKTAIDALYEFRRKLGELHPQVLDLIENMLQKQRY